RKAVFEAARETVTPRLLAMLSVVSVFVPSFFMTGVARALFIPLSLAVGFAMLASYVLSSTLVPVLANWLLPERAAAGEDPLLGRIYARLQGGLLQLRLRAPTGTRVERTELVTLQVLDAIREEAGPGNVAITLDFTGVQPASYPVNTIHLWTSGPQEAVLLVALRKSCPYRVDEFQERLRPKLAERFPGVSFSFEAGDLVSKI